MIRKFIGKLLGRSRTGPADDPPTPAAPPLGRRVPGPANAGARGAMRRAGSLAEPMAATSTPKPEIPCAVLEPTL